MLLPISTKVRKHQVATMNVFTDFPSALTVADMENTITNDNLILLINNIYLQT